nr:hypothetical protein [Bacteroidota bacterium]
MKNLIKAFCVGSLLITTFQVHAQDDLTKMLDEQPQEKQKVLATFKTTKLINSQTNETVHKRVLDFRVGHRFGNIGGNSGGGVHTLYGLDQSADIRIAFDYGITERLTVGFSRSKVKENLEGSAKFRILEQTTNNKMPIALTWFSNMAFTPESNDDIYLVSENGSLKNRDVRRLAYTHQLIIARKFSSAFSFQLVPTLMHRNYSPDYKDDNNIMALGGAARIKVTRSMTVIADYFYVMNKYHRTVKNADGNLMYNDPLGIGIELETGGHVFSLMFTNASSIIETEMLANTTDSWGKGGFKFSFNISRNFSL